MWWFKLMAAVTPSIFTPLATKRQAGVDFTENTRLKPVVAGMTELTAGGGGVYSVFFILGMRCGAAWPHGGANGVCGFHLMVLL